MDIENAFQAPAIDERPMFYPLEVWALLKELTANFDPMSVSGMHFIISIAVREIDSMAI